MICLVLAQVQVTTNGSFGQVILPRDVCGNE
jgi:hypothetical protein